MESGRPDVLVTAPCGNCPRQYRSQWYSSESVLSRSGCPGRCSSRRRAGTACAGMRGGIGAGGAASCVHDHMTWIVSTDSRLHALDVRTIGSILVYTAPTVARGRYNFPAASLLRCCVGPIVYSYQIPIDLTRQEYRQSYRVRCRVRKQHIILIASHGTI